MSRSVRVRLEYIETVKLALRRNGYPRQQDLVEKVNISKNTVNKFFNGKPIDYLNFTEICNTLSLDWQEIADLEGEKLPQNTPESNTTEQTLSVTVEVNRDLEVNLPDKDDTQRNQAREKRVISQQAIPNVPVWKGRDELLHKLKEKLLPRELLETRFLGETGFLNSPKVLAIIGQGGIGKTSLAVKLIENLTPQPHSLRGKGEKEIYDCVMYFKAQEGTSFDDVAEFLLDGLGTETPEPLKTADEKIGKIIAGLAENCCLLVLDNLESVLHPANHPQAGKAVSLDWGKLLNALVYQQHISQTILTSREVPADLADTRYEGAEPDTELVHIETLTGVSNQAGVDILQQRQLKDKPEDLQWVSGRVEGHVFLLTQLAAIGKGKPGYLRKHPEFVTKKAEPILQEQLARQSEAARDLLKRMCVLRVPIDVRGLTFLRLYTDDLVKDFRFWIAAEFSLPTKFTQEEVSETEAILKPLLDSSLVQCHYDKNNCDLFYDLHRVIKQFLKTKYKNESSKAMESIYKFYCSSKYVLIPKRLEDLLPVLEAQYFAFQLGKYNEAFNLIIWPLDEYLGRWGNWELLKNLYAQIMPYVEKNNCSICLRQIGRYYSGCGNLDLAEKHFQAALAIEKKRGSQRSIAILLSDLGNIEFSRGNWDEAERLYTQCSELVTELYNLLNMGDSSALSRNNQGYYGDCNKAEPLYRLSSELVIELRNLLEMLSPSRVPKTIEFNYHYDWGKIEQIYGKCLKVITELGIIRDIAAFWSLFGKIDLRRGNWEQAEKLYLQSLKLATKLGDRHNMANSIGGLGKTQLSRGNLEASENLLKDGLSKMQELEMTWHIAETNYDLAQLYRQRNNPELAQQHYNTAHQIYQQLGAAKDLERIEKEWQ